MPPNNNRLVEHRRGQRDRHRYSRHELILFAEAVLAVSMASVAIKMPFRWLARLMSITAKARRPDDGISAMIAEAVDRASRRLPWKSLCFQQGLAAHWLLRRRGIASTLHYGIRIGDELAAHVWVTVGGKIILGEAEAANHACVATFPPPVG